MLGKKKSVFLYCWITSKTKVVLPFVVGKNGTRCRDGVKELCMVSFLPCLVAFMGNSIPTCSFSFENIVTLGVVFVVVVVLSL